ncbi:MAG: PAS domain S-box protein [Verrucomicrobiae bacterium]|nr:PAS domain S-box protein [Verrucomicrobiae bacterium]
MNSHGGVSASSLRNQIAFWLSLIAGLLLCLFICFAAGREYTAARRRSFNETHLRIQTTLSERFNNCETILNSAQSLLHASPGIGRSEWRYFVESLNLDKCCPGIQGLGYICRINRFKLKAFETACQADGFSNYSVHPKGERLEYFPIKYIEPQARNLSSIGFDAGTHPGLFSTLAEARDTGQLRITGRIKLVPDSSDQAGFAVYLPVYKHGARLKTTGERQEALEGWIHCAFRMDDFMRGILPHEISLMDIRIHDGPATDESRLFFSSIAGSSQPATAAKTLQASSKIDFGGREWTLQMTAYFDGIHSWLIPGAGVLIFALVLFVIFTLTRRYRQLIRHARRTSADLHLRDRAMETSSNGFIITNPNLPDNPIIYVNRAFERITGYPASEVIGKNCRFLHGKDDQQKPLAEVRKAIHQQQDCRVVLRNFRKNGAVFWNELSVSPIRDKNGKITHFLGVLVDISERRWVEEALSEERFLLRTLIDNLPDSVYVKDTESRFILANQAHMRLLGVTMEDDVVGQSDFDFFPNELAAHFYNDEQTAMRLQQVLAEREEMIADREGNKRWFLTTKVPLKDGKNRIIGLVGVSHDITERKRVLETLAEDRNLLRSLIDNVTDWIYAKDIDGRFIICNVAYARAVGASSPNEIVGKTDMDYFPRLQAEQFQSQEQLLLSSGKPFFGAEETWTDKAGNKRWLQSIKWPLRDGRGTVVGLVGIGRDITDRVQSESERALLAVAIQHATESIIITDEQGNIQYVNGSFELASGCSRHEALHKNLSRIQGQKEHPQFHEQLFNVLRQGKTWHGLIRSQNHDGQEYLEEASVTPMRDAGNKTSHFVVVKRDITKERQLEEQFRQAQKMEAVGQLAGGIAHDFNNTIGVIVGYSELILRKLEKNNPIVPKIESMRNSAQKASQIIRQLLAFSRRQILQPAVIDINPHLQQMSEMVQRLISENISLSIQPEASQSQIKVDPNYLDQVILNLVVNARDAMLHGGKLDIRTANLQITPENAASYAGLKPGLHLTISVQDSGSGMPPEVQAHLFEPFFTTKGRSKGTGLGLSTAYGIIKQSDGCIDFKSEPGHGTVFNIHFPCVLDETAIPSTAAKDSVNVLRGNEIILAVEDEQGVLTMVGELLDGLGYKIIPARSPEEALEKTRQHSGDIHLLFTDIVMPGMSGIDLARQFRQLRPKAKILFTSGYAGQAIQKEGLINPLFNFISKPYDLPTLARRIRIVLDATEEREKKEKVR